MMIASQEPLASDTQVAVSFCLTPNNLIIVRGIVRSAVKASGNLPERYGIEFISLEFQHKRAIRNFVAAATAVDGHIAG